MANATVNQENDELDALYEQVMSCESAIPEAQLEPLSELVKSNEYVGRQWRLTAFLASKNGDFFHEVSVNAEQAEALAATIAPLRHFAVLMRQMADLADCASSRLLVAGCNHENFNDWVKEAT